ncbi:Rac GTPase-activating protein 1 [Clonorchis sinensis]|uniref:Rac GTPase-activating protein 1 n=1 Tax=Clonorchis sinensis TaxID=79923 RepID=A0A419QC95_CLOSI|nr:Rac GTPase-activating protein 1 [Clonorchis sinensis]
MIGDKSVQSTKLEHSAGSLLDTANVSDDSEVDACRKETFGNRYVATFLFSSRTSKSRRASSAGHAMDMVRGPLRRSARLSKLRASSAPKIAAPDLSTEHNQHGYNKSPPAGHKRRSDDSDDSYYGVEMKRSLLTIPHTAHHLPSTVTEEDSDFSNFHFRSRIELYEKFFGKVTPVLARVEDIHVVCGCLKMFLRSLTEPLVTYEQRSVLAAASEGARLGDPDAIQHVINVLDALPAPNRDTLSYIMLHLKTIAQAPDCQMGEENLAKVFGPTLVGYSCPEPQLMQTVTETRTQQAVLRLLFSVPDHIYSAIVTRQPDEQDSEPIDDGHTTYFSPIFTRPEPLPTQSATSLQLRKTPHRNLVMSARKRFFPQFSHRDPMNPS